MEVDKQKKKSVKFQDTEAKTEQSKVDEPKIVVEKELEEEEEEDILDFTQMGRSYSILH